MPDWKTALASTPDISFIDGRTIEDVKAEMVADYESRIVVRLLQR